MSCQAEIGIGTAVPPFLGHCLRNLVISAGARTVQPICGLSLLKTRHRAGFKALLRHQQAADGVQFSKHKRRIQMSLTARRQSSSKACSAEYFLAIPLRRQYGCTTIHRFHNKKNY